MAFFGLFEQRNRPQRDFTISQASTETFLIGGQPSFTGESITVDAALGIPAISAAVNVISSTIASLPLGLFKKSDDGRVKADNLPLYRIIHDVVNADLMTSFQWRKTMVFRYLIEGRAYTFVETDKAGRVTNLWPLETNRVTPEIREGRRIYRYQSDHGEIIYLASEIIDLAQTLCSDGLTHKSPLAIHKNTIGEMIAAQKSAATMFASGGIPAHVIKMPKGSPEATAKAADSIFDAMASMRAKKQPGLPLMDGFDITPIGLDPQKQQHLELREWQTSEVARIFSIPPSFIQDHSHSTFSNIEHLNLHYSQHTILPIVALIEAELNAKLFSDRNRNTYVEFNMEGLERGDKKSQYEGFRIGIHGGFLKPNEVRKWLNLPEEEGGDVLYIQGATTKMTDAETNDKMNDNKDSDDDYAEGLLPKND